MMKKRVLKTIYTKRKACPFCIQKTRIDYKDVATLRRFLSERGRILSRSRTRVCAAHQRQLSMAVKRARIIALVPFVVGV